MNANLQLTCRPTYQGIIDAFKKMVTVFVHPHHCYAYVVTVTDIACPLDGVLAAEYVSDVGTLSDDHGAIAHPSLE